MNVAVIGGGAAGFFAAINIKDNFPDASVTIFEKSTKVLGKVKISGGGRCNVTNASTDIAELSAAYPRGGNALKKCFGTFNTKDTQAWFAARQIPLVAEEDGRVFPASQNSQTIIDCFLDEAEEKDIQVKRGFGVSEIRQRDTCLELDLGSWRAVYDKVVVATGGSPRREGLTWLEDLGHEIEEPVPSLFTFNMPLEGIISLPGLSVEKALVSIQGTKLKTEGPLLITHWGLSGPAILRLSAFGARTLSERNYEFNLQINWARETNQVTIQDHLEKIQIDHQKKKLTSIKPYGVPDRLWRFLLEKNGFSLMSSWQELGKKALNRMVNALSNDIYKVQGKTSFKEEFVTCGGVSLKSVNMRTMESKVCPNLYFAGEILDIDGITGGFNFQAAWTTGFIAAKLSKDL